MKVALLSGTIGAVLLIAPVTFAQDQKTETKSTQAKRSGMSQDMRRAIEFERFKDRAAARQAAIEARHSGADRSANRTRNDKDTSGNVKATKTPRTKSKQ